jgi:hypothetical protein
MTSPQSFSATTRTRIHQRGRKSKRDSAHFQDIVFNDIVPMKRGLVDNPEQWERSSVRSYLYQYQETGLVRVVSHGWRMSARNPRGRQPWNPTLQKTKGRAPAAKGCVERTLLSAAFAFDF